MLAKLTAKDRLTLPRAVVREFPGSEYLPFCETVTLPDPPPATPG